MTARIPLPPRPPILRSSGPSDDPSHPSFPSFLLSQRPRLDCDTGIVGRIVDLIRPHTEADPWMIRACVLAVSSAFIGSAPKIRVGFGNLHPARLYLCGVGDTGQGRKGMGWGEVESLARQALDDFMDEHVIHGLASGEGTVNALNDMDPDKRALVYEPELARLLSAMSREGSTLSPIVRQLWDSGTVHVPTRSNPLKVNDAHIAALCHVTRDELRLNLRASDMANGFGNRFLWIGVHRHAVRPFGGDVDETDKGLVASDWRKCLTGARDIKAVRFGDAETRDLWKRWYIAQADAAGKRVGMDAAANARTEAQALRLALLYALLDGRDELTVCDLYAGWTVLAHASATLRKVWPVSATGEPDCDQLLDLILKDGEVAKSRITVMFKTAARGDAIAAVLVEQKLAEWHEQRTTGRTALVLRATDAGKEGRK